MALTGGRICLSQRLPVSAKGGGEAELRELVQLRTGVVVAFSAGARNLDEVSSTDKAADRHVAGRGKGFELRAERGGVPERAQGLEITVGGTGEHGIGCGRGENCA